jgi:DNA-binding response OmpR family regulator
MICWHDRRITCRVLSKRVLVVDDDKSILRLVATILKHESYRVDTASGGKEAIAMMALTAYDAIVLDLMMPEVTGYDVLRSLQNRIPEVTCVVIMSAASTFDVVRAINPNVFAILSKPFDYPLLIGSVRGCVAACGLTSLGLPHAPLGAAA